MTFIEDDGGRQAAGYRGYAGDCVVRAICIATGLPYQQVYDDINQLAKRERIGKRKRKISSARTGVFKQTTKRYLTSLGWKWTPTMKIGSGCTVHLHDGELPMGRLIVRVSKHVTAVIDGVIHDTHDPQRATLWYEAGAPKPVRITRRCVYGYFSKEQS